MSEDKAREIRRTWRESGDAVAALAQLDATLREEAPSPALLCLRGDLIQCQPEGATYPLAEARFSYERALELDGTCIEAHTELGYYFDAVEDDPAEAAANFQRAIEHGGSLESHLGLARCMAELGHTERAVELLRSSRYAEASEVAGLISEIVQGVWRPA